MTMCLYHEHTAEVQAEHQSYRFAPKMSLLYQTDAKTAVPALTVIIAVILIRNSVTVGILQSCISKLKPKVLQL